MRKFTYFVVTICNLSMLQAPPEQSNSRITPPYSQVPLQERDMYRETEYRQTEYTAPASGLQEICRTFSEAINSDIVAQRLDLLVELAEPIDTIARAALGERGREVEFGRKFLNILADDWQLRKLAMESNRLITESGQLLETVPIGEERQLIEQVVAFRILEAEIEELIETGEIAIRAGAVKLRKLTAEGRVLMEGIVRDRVEYQMEEIQE